jgi:hypothetical protein
MPRPRKELISLADTPSTTLLHDVFAVHFCAELIITQARVTNIAGSGS